MLRTNFSPKASYSVRVPVSPNDPNPTAFYDRSVLHEWAKGTHELKFFDLSYSHNMRSPYIDSKALVNHVEELADAHPEIQDYPFDFSVIYEIRRK